MKDFALPSYQGSTPSCSRPVLMAPLHDSSDGQQLGYYSSDGQGLWYLEVGDRLFIFLSDHRPAFRRQCRSRFCHSSLPTSVFFFYPQANKNKAVLGCAASNLSQQANKGGVREKSVKTRETTLPNKSEDGAWPGTSKFLWWLFLSDLRKRGESVEQ